MGPEKTSRRLAGTRMNSLPTQAPTTSSSFGVYEPLQGNFASEAERRHAENLAALQSGERERLLKKKKKPMSFCQKLSYGCFGQQGCDWGMTCILLSVVALGVVMSCLAAFGQFANWNMMVDTRTDTRTRKTNSRTHAHTLSLLP